MMHASLDVGTVAGIRNAIANVREPWRPVRTLVRNASAITGIAESEILADNRRREIAWVRFAIMAAARSFATLTAIARAMQRDHTTILQGLRRAEEIRARDTAFADLIDVLTAIHSEDPHA